ncbi:MAG TPA: MASE1 domain-containing protein, partial [Polyangiaceae bacterium]
MAALAIVYLAAAKLGLAMDAVSGFATLVWPPTGVAFAALLLFGLPLWPGVWVGAFIANMWTGAPALVAGGIATGNTLEAVVGATLLIRVLGFHPGMAKIRDAIGFVFIAAILSTAISATVGVSSLLAGHVIRMDSFAETWRAWWLGDVIGALVLAPLLLTWTSLGIPAPSSGRLLEVACLSVLLAVTSVLVFGRHAGAIGPFYQPYLLLMPVI